MTQLMLTNMKEHVYIVMYNLSDVKYEKDWWIDEVFRSRESAEKYIKEEENEERYIIVKKAIL